MLESGFAMTSKFSPHKIYGKFHCDWMHDVFEQTSISRSVAPGGYVLLFDLNFEQKVEEPIHNNRTIVELKMT